MVDSMDHVDHLKTKLKTVLLLRRESQSVSVIELPHGDPVLSLILRLSRLRSLVEGSTSISLVLHFRGLLLGPDGRVAVGQARRGFSRWFGVTR